MSTHAYPLKEIRGRCLHFFEALAARDKPSVRGPYRVAKFEVFEQRTVLSAAGLAALPVAGVVAEYEEIAAPAPQGEFLQQAFSIESIMLRINGTRDVTIGSLSEPLSLHAGDTLEVIGIDYTVSELGDGLDGVIAVEGYLHKLDETHGPGALDYGDGRFGDPVNGDPITLGEVRQGGLEGTWTVEQGWDRIALVLIRYYGDQSESVANFSAQLQVETPDFTMSNKSLQKLKDQTFRVGETAYVTIEWGNAGKGRYHNYLEMDVHHANNMEDPVWVGVSVATLGKKESVSLVLENGNANDAFTQYWTPQEAGLHKLLIVVDPEDAWQEKKETNNRVEIWVNVKAAVEESRQATGRNSGRRVTHGSLLGPAPVADPIASPPASGGHVAVGPLAEMDRLSRDDLRASEREDVRRDDERFDATAAEPFAAAKPRRSAGGRETSLNRGEASAYATDEDEFADVDVVLSGDDLLDSDSDPQYDPLAS